jgi:hypothetical protein
MNRTHRIAHLLAPAALLGGVIAATPAAHAAPSNRVTSRAQLNSAAALAHGPRVSPDLTIKICINNHCVVIKF